MWNRRKTDEEPIRPLGSSPSPEPAREGIPAATAAPVRTYEPDVPRSTATIGKSVRIKGNIASREDLVIDGEVEGGVEATEHRITIGPNGRVVAHIKARDVVVIGNLKGNIEASGRVDIRKGAHLVGDIRYAKISIEEGADLRGSLEMIRTETKPEPAPAAKIVEAAKSADPAKPVQQSLGSNEANKK